MNVRACVNGLSVNEQVGVAIAAHDSLASIIRAATTMMDGSEST